MSVKIERNYSQRKCELFIEIIFKCNEVLILNKLQLIMYTKVGKLAGNLQLNNNYIASKIQLEKISSFAQGW